MLNKRWRFRPIDENAARDLSRALGVSPALGRLLVARDFHDASEALRFLTPGSERLHDPSLLPGIDAAAERIASAVRAKEPILIHGDYDVDGVCAAATLARGLKALGGKIAVFAPHRILDGYDLQPPAVETAHREGIRLIVTCDCGIQAIPAAERAAELGIDLVITDHHEPGPDLPKAVAVVNPRRSDSAYPFPAICGTAVAFKVLQATTRALGSPESGLARAFLELVAIGTVADMMPLRDENREIVRFGLQQLASTKKHGLRALLDNCLSDRGVIRAEDVAFQIAPRINAVGRLEDAQAALDLLLCGDYETARLLAQRMEEANLRRRREQDRIFKEAEEIVLRKNLEESPILILSCENWHSGLIGPVASRMVEAHRKPAILISYEGDMGRGSARTAGDFQLMTALESCRDLMERCGGHQQAAGFDLPHENLSAFETRMSRIAAEAITPESLEDQWLIDAAIPPSEITLSLCEEIGRMEPFGHGNPSPLFFSALEVSEVRRIGKTGAHLKLIVRGEGLPPTEAIFWRQGESESRFTRGDSVEFCYRLGIHRFRDQESVQLDIADARFANEPS